MKRIDQSIIKIEKPSSERSQKDLEQRKNEILIRLEQINGPADVTNPSNQGIPIPTPKVLHWDHLQKEIIWLAGDFQRERLRHVNNGKRIAKAIEVYNKTKEAKEIKKMKDDALALRRISSRLSRDVRKFWMKVDKIVAFKQKSDADETRQKAMDKHLVHLIKQTERYTSLLAENLRIGGSVGLELSKKPVSSSSENYETISNSSKDVETIPTHISERSFEEESDDEFVLSEHEVMEDDETTMIEEEGRERDISTEEEIKLLKDEGNLPIEELRKMYANLPEEKFEEEGDDDDDDDESHEVTSQREGQSDEGESDDEYVEVEEAVDDETTLIAEEQQLRDLSVEEEVKLLQKESEIPVEELRALYSKMNEELSSDDDNDEMNDGDSEVESEADEPDYNQKSFDEYQGDIQSDDEDFEQDSDAVSEDDETTLLEEEARDRDMPVNQEIEMLKKESEMSIEELREMYKNLGDMEDSPDSMDEGNHSENDVETSHDNTEGSVKGRKVQFSTSEDEHDSDEDYSEMEEELDDETTLLAEESLHRDESVEEEIRMLKEEGEMTIEQLRAKYADLEKMVHDDEDEETYEDGDMDEGSENADDDDSVASKSSPSEDIDPDENREDQDQDTSDDFGNALKRLESADLAARSVHVDRPFILSNSITLREYQHVGLNWLVSLHERRLNGILADEMGLGKTIQTISLLAYLAAYRGLWGPHLIVVPTSCIVNWETEFKKWCPVFKVLTYYGGAKMRKNLRLGWSKLNSFHVCITSYQLVVQDSSSFRRKRWYYMILDEAHNIKNFKSQRWQTLLNFNTQRRLLLTGTPLQNNLMELWSLMHFLMPHIFRSRKEFSYWFSNPLSNMVEGNRSVNNDVISKLHGIMRPFLLRRLKKDVEKQLPAKYEHVIMCKLSKRQQLLYEEYMSRTATKASLSGGNYLGMMNILMQLRKVCNHPDLFEPRPITSPFVADAIYYNPPHIVLSALDNHPLDQLSDFQLKFWLYNEDSNVQDYLIKYKADQSQFIVIDDMNFPIDESINKPHYRSYLLTLKNKYFTLRRQRLNFNFQISNQRCVNPKINITWRTVKAVTIDDSLPQLAIKARTDSKIRRNMPECWFDLVKSVEDRAESVEDMIKTFVFILPKIIVSRQATGRKLYDVLIADTVVTGCGRYFIQRADVNDIHQTRQRLRNAMSPFYLSTMRQSIFFPDRKLIQFDSGKLQTLSVLLNDLKRTGHKVLLFTQMSKMLDILEIFLNLHGHTYVRLDGSTGVDRRQKLMDRFNTDPKLFCFILSTRSGGLGINLTGADTVIFYDSDWNPAMDAQAQDRAHRIGQTREVHIYRLVSSSTVEENILIKARQKRHLDFLVMTEGNFSEESLFTSNSLQDMLGIKSDNVKDSFPSSTDAMPTDIAAAMAAVEDDEDVSALRQAERENEKEQSEFDENQSSRVATDLDEEDNEILPEPSPSVKQINAANVSQSSQDSLVIDKEKEEKDIEQEFASWQAKIGPDINALQNALRPVERYAFNLHTNIEPFYSIFYIQEQQRLQTMDMEEKELNEQWDVDAIEREREEEEYRALSEGELLATNLSKENAIALKSWFMKERGRVKRDRRRRIMTGEGWSLVIDPATKVPFWYNEDTGEASYAMPDIIQAKEMMDTARERGYSALPIKIMIHIFSYLSTYPDRMIAGTVCHRWNQAYHDEIFHLRVLPVESGARDAKNVEMLLKRYDSNTFASIDDAIHRASAGDTIMLGGGHHWESSLVIDKPLKIIGDCEDPSRCVIELTGEIYISKAAKSAVISTVSIRRPRKIPKRVACFTANHAIVEIFNCIISNEGSQSSSTLVAINSSSLLISGGNIRGGSLAGISAFNSSILLANTKISNNSGHGISLTDGDCYLDEVLITQNGKIGLSVNSSSVLISDSNLESNGLGSILIDDLSEESPSTVRCRDSIGDDAFMQYMSRYKWEEEETPTYESMELDENTYINEATSGYDRVGNGMNGHMYGQSFMRVPSIHANGSIISNGHAPRRDDTSAEEAYHVFIPSQHSKQALLQF